MLLALIIIAVILTAVFLYNRLSAQFRASDGISAGDSSEDTDRAAAPDFSVSDAKGNTVSLLDFIGETHCAKFLGKLVRPMSKRDA